MPKYKILVGDDQKTNSALLKLQLKDVEIIEAGDGGTALRKVRDEKPDLILLDVVMPGVDGYSVLSILKKAEETKHIPIIVVTGLNGLEERVKSLEKGADDFITKPFNLMELRARMKPLLRVKELQDELQGVQNTLVALCEEMEKRKGFGAAHSKQVAYYAEKLAQKVFYLKSEREQIKTAALLHDIGKMGIKESILMKPSQLDTGEFASIKEHPLIGEKICSKLSSTKAILPYIRHHHERYDGSGYPDGLKGTEIPLGARILAVADAFDALISG